MATMIRVELTPWYDEQPLVNRIEINGWIDENCFHEVYKAERWDSLYLFEDEGEATAFALRWAHAWRRKQTG